MRVLLITDLKVDPKQTLEGARRLLEEFQSILPPVVLAHDGSVVKHAGDGALCLFETARDAVWCAVDLQLRIAARNAGVPSGRHMLAGIGIHLGEVQMREGEAGGRAVDTAAGLEQISAPGGIAISRAVHGEINSIRQIQSESMGTRDLGSVIGTIQVHRVLVVMPGPISRASERAPEPSYPADALREHRVIRVMVVDDSATARAVLVELLESDREIEVVGTASDGQEAVDRARRLRPDLITMDLRMPNMDGLRATQEIMETFPVPIVIVSSSIAAPDLQITFNALRAGALDVIEKPGPDYSDAKRGTLLSAVHAMAEIPVVRRHPTKVRFTERAAGAFDVVAIGASTGGPPLLGQILGTLPADFPCPILITQHISQGFTVGFADWLQSQVRIGVSIAIDGEPLLPGRAYIAPDDRHLRVTADRRVQLGSDPPIDRFRPSVDALFHSAAVLGPRAVGIILTGMGADGARGLLALRQAGGWTLAQDAASSTVDGMPGSARRLQAVDRTVTPAELCDLMINEVSRRRT